MQEREIAPLHYDMDTKTRILNEATILFAQRGFASVSMRIIANAANIKMASIYYYYENKDELFENIMERFEQGYVNYLTWLKGKNNESRSLEELMDNMFNAEVMEFHDIIGCCGISLVVKEQHNNKSAGRLYFELLMNHSTKSLKADFDRLVEKGCMLPVDTQTIATIIMNHILVTNDLRLHNFFNTNNTEPDCLAMHSNLKRFITSTLTPKNRC